MENTIKDINTYKLDELDTDHIPTVACLKIKFRKSEIKNTMKRTTYKGTHSDEQKVKMNKIVTELLEDRGNTYDTWKGIINTIEKLVESSEVNEKRKEWMSDKTWKWVEERGEAIKQGNNTRADILTQNIKNQIRRDKREWHTKQVSEELDC